MEIGDKVVWAYNKMSNDVGEVVDKDNDTVVIVWNGKENTWINQQRHFNGEVRMPRPGEVERRIEKMKEQIARLEAQGVQGVC